MAVKLFWSWIRNVALGNWCLQMAQNPQEPPQEIGHLMAPGGDAGCSVWDLAPWLSFCLGLCFFAI